eukprot:gene23459-17318_t
MAKPMPTYPKSVTQLNNGQAYVHTSEAGYAGGARTEDLYTYTQNAVNNMWTMKQTVPTAASFGAPGYGIASLYYGLTASISSTGFMPIIAAMGKQLFGLGALDSATQLDFTGVACKWFHATAASGLTTSDTTAYWIAAHLQTGTNRYIMLLVQVDLVKGTPVAYAREAGWTGCTKTHSICESDLWRVRGKRDGQTTGSLDTAWRCTPISIPGLAELADRIVT